MASRGHTGNCPNCQSPFPAHANFCLNCGQPIGPADSGLSNAQRQPLLPTPLIDPQILAQVNSQELVQYLCQIAQFHSAHLHGQLQYEWEGQQVFGQGGESSGAQPHNNTPQPAITFHHHSQGQQQQHGWQGQHVFGQGGESAVAQPHNNTLQLAMTSPLLLQSPQREQGWQGQQVFGQGGEDSAASPHNNTPQPARTSHHPPQGQQQQHGCQRVEETVCKAKDKNMNLHSSSKPRVEDAANKYVSQPRTYAKVTSANNNNGPDNQDLTPNAVARDRSAASRKMQTTDGTGTRTSVNILGQKQHFGAAGDNPGSRLRSQDNDNIQVDFFVALSLKNFKFDQNKHQVHVRFEHKHLGGFSSDNKKPCWILKCVGGDGDIRLYRISVPIPRRNVTGCSSLRYKYVIKRSEKDWIFEYLTRGEPDKCGHFNRSLKKIQGDAWRQYDGAIHCPTSGNVFTKVIKSVENKVLHTQEKETARRTKKAAQIMLENIGSEFLSAPQADGTGFLRHLTQMCQGTMHGFDNTNDISEVFESFIRWMLSQYHALDVVAPGASCKSIIVDEAASNSTTDAEKTSTTDAERTSTTDAKRTSTTDAERTSTTDAERTSTTDAERTSTTDAERTSTTDTERTSTTDAERTSTIDAERTSTTDAERTSTTDAERTSTTDAGRTSTTDAERTSTTDAERTSTTDAERTSTTDAERTSSTDAERTTNTDAERTSNTDAERTSTTDTERSSTTDAERTSTTDAQRTSTTDAERTSTTDAERTSTTDAERTSPSDAVKISAIHAENNLATDKYTVTKEGKKLAITVTLTHIAVQFNFNIKGKPAKQLLMNLLLHVDSTNKSCPQYEELTRFHFPDDTMRSEIAKSLQTSMTKANHSYWMHALPLYHFLSDLSKPFRPINVQMHQNDLWWGVDGFTETVHSTKDKLTTQQLVDYLSTFAPMFEADQLLARSLLAVTRLEHLPQLIDTQLFPLDALLANLYYHIASIQPVDKNLHSVLKDFNNFMQKRRKLQHRDSAKDSKQCIVIALDAIKKFCATVSNYLAKEAFFLLLNIVLACLEDFYHCSSNANDQNDHCDDLWEITRSYVKAVSPSIAVFPAKQDLELMETLYNISIDERHIANFWHHQVVDYFRNRIQQMDEVDFLKMCCLDDTKLLSAEMLEVLDIHAQEVLSTLCQADDERLRRFLRDLTAHQGAISDQGIEFVSSLFKKMWSQDSDNNCMLQYILENPYFRSFLVIYKKPTSASLLDETCTADMARALSLFENIMKDFESGAATLFEVECILKHDDSALQLCLGLAQPHGASFSYSGEARGSTFPKHVQLEAVMNWRRDEFAYYRRTMEYASKFIAVCDEIPCKVELEELKEMVRNNKTDVSIKSLWDPMIYHPDLAGEDSPAPRIHILTELGSAVVEAITSVGECYESRLFHHILQHESMSEETEGIMSLNEMIEKVWQPTFEKWLKVKANVTDGSISCLEIDEYFEDLLKDNHDGMFNEVQLLVNDEDKALQRCKQLKTYLGAEDHIKAANVVQRFQERYKLLGDFSALGPWLKEVDKTQTLDGFAQNIEESRQEMQKFNPERISVLQAFLDCDPLIKWVKTNVPERRQLTALVELAMAAATGQGDLEVQKVSCLQSAVMAYSPLIYDLKEKDSFARFLRHCGEVWAVSDMDSKLPTKLRDTNVYLEWLKQLRQSYGSMEANALNQVKTIHCQGTYIIGNTEGDQHLDLESIVRVRVDGPDVETHYSYSDLKDLQSKLMLIADKSQVATMEQFVNVFNGVCNLGEIYRKLLLSGSIFFDDWAFSFTALETSVTQNISTFSESHTDLLEQVSIISQNLEGFLHEWETFIKKMRTESYSLNYYTTQQLVFLRQQLAQLYRSQPRNRKLDPNLLSLLHSVKADCTEDEILNAIVQSFNDLSPKNRDQPVIDWDEEVVKTFLTKITEAGYSLADAKMALERYSPDEYEEAIMWLMEESDNIVDDTRPKEAGNVQMNESFQSLTSGLYDTLAEEPQQTLSGKMGALWASYLEHVETSLGTCISVPHLGYTLENLANLEPYAVYRQLPAYLKKGQPNLIVCPESEVLATVLTIYMVNQVCPLPSSDEVLMCTEDTTTEEIELLWLRALGDGLFDRYGRIYCLVNADQLRPLVCDKLEECLQSPDALQCKGYRLVAVCSQVGEQRSHLVNILHPHRVNYSRCYDDREIHAYLQHHLTCNQGVQHSAASFDPDRCGVRVVKSLRSGMGKTLWIQRIADKLPREGTYVKVPLNNKHIDANSLAQELLPHGTLPKRRETRVFHLDLAHYVESGVDHVMFSLLVLGSLTDQGGMVWRKHKSHLYLIESVPLLRHEAHTQKRMTYMHSVLALLPSVMCWSPMHSQLLLQDPHHAETRLSQQCPLERVNLKVDQLLDEASFQSEEYQHPFEYLRQSNPDEPYETDHIQFLNSTLRNCGIEDPSWSELKRFLAFLTRQLCDFEMSPFCGDAGSRDLPGFKQFMQDFLILMSRDFATRSLSISEESQHTYQLEDVIDEEDTGLHYELKRRWENSPHPYIFFNQDRTFSFFGFHVNELGRLWNPVTKEVLEGITMSVALREALCRNKVPLDENFDGLDREEKLGRLLHVMGRDYVGKRDDTYELTMDNVIKILAIHMRFRCGIPVVVMGETGSGKTRLVQFMCDLLKPYGCEDARNMVLMKIHGGTKERDIHTKLQEASALASENREKYGPEVPTVLFFDEANTTEAVGLIKEIMCDGTLGGNIQQQLRQGELHLVAACNPYRRHTDEMIRRLEAAGLGYRIRAEETRDTLGRVPLRQLVYRVHALPHSLVPLIWDFGQLNDHTELLYIQQMVKKTLAAHGLRPYYGPLISKILAASQQYMRKQGNEVSFVSLRDVERALRVMIWFYKQTELYKMMDTMIAKESDRGKPVTNPSDSDDTDEASDGEESEDSLDNEPIAAAAATTRVSAAAERKDETTRLRRSVILALGVCYQACLESRKEYQEAIADEFCLPLSLPKAAKTISDEIDRCQWAFLEQIDLGPNIAKNQALRENIFMMVVCIELRIPLFLVGKPGSSKSLAKTIVNDAMQRDQSRSKLFRSFKKVQMVTFQCSQLSKPDGIIGTFRQCAKLQEEQSQHLDKYVSVVVLDEVGLAEDSPEMPLKTLHPLLENGCIDDEEVEDYKKVAFIGISNWALDPAKMNRGILVQRHAPNEEELIDSARGICGGNKEILKHITSLIPLLTKAYLAMYHNTNPTKSEEFFGLRDFYSLVKMVYSFAEKNKRQPTREEIRHAILRNFGGIESSTPPLEVFKEAIDSVQENQSQSEAPGCSTPDLIEASLSGAGLTSERRYLLLMTENYAALDILHDTLLNNQKEDSRKKPIIIFGSSFPKDQEYTQVCRNIHRIKVCMQAGHTVVLLNLENLYESLYDALNQYYLYFGDQKYVDVGLGTHRIKCLVHDEFRLVVVAQKQVVYSHFPIPLINRLEKHVLSASSLLSQAQARLAQRLTQWVNQVIKTNVGRGVREPRKRDVFVGYHEDTPSVTLLEVCRRSQVKEKELMSDEHSDKILAECKEMLMQNATPESVVRLHSTSLPNPEIEWLSQVYRERQTHDNLHQFLQKHMQSDFPLFAKISTYGHLLSEENVASLPHGPIKLLHLLKFDTEEQFTAIVRKYFRGEIDAKLLIIQCDSGEVNAKLIACAQHHLDNLSKDDTGRPVVILVKLPKDSTTCNYLSVQGGKWMTYHIEELFPDNSSLPQPHTLVDRKVSDVLSAYVQSDLPLTAEATGIRSYVTSLEDYEEEGVAFRVGGADDDRDSTEDGDDADDEEGKTAPNESLTLDDELAFRGKVGPIAEQRVSGPVTNDVLLDDLIASCLHEAVSMMRTPTGHLKRPELVQLLSRILFDQSGDDDEFGKCLLNLIKTRLVSLMRQGEDMHMTGDMATSWLLKQVASTEAVTQAGTFRQSVWNYLQKRVIPLLARILTSIATNDNMLFLTPEPDKLWLRTIWICMFEDANIAKVSASDGGNQREFLVKTLAAAPFTPHLPFSWIIKEKLDHLLHQHSIRSGAGQFDVICTLLLDVFGCALRSIPAHCHEEFAQRYLHDYVCMVYKPKTQETKEMEYKVVEEWLNVVSQAVCEDSMYRDENSLNRTLMYLIALHLAHTRMRKLLELFGEALKLHPPILERLVVFRSSEPEHYLNKTMDVVLHVKLAKCILDSVAPTKEQLNDSETCRAWFSLVERFQVVIIPLLELIQHDVMGESRLRQYSKECSCAWMRVQAVHMFVDHIYPMDLHCMPLWAILGDTVDFTQERSLNKVENFLKRTNQTTYDKISRNRRCEICREVSAASVLLPCTHEFCANCVTEWVDMNEFVCPNCDQPFPSDIHIPESEDEVISARYGEYKQKCVAFYMELVSRLCFSGESPPDDGIVRKLVQHITRPTSQREETGVWDVDSIEVTPSVRSFLLQLLLHTRREMVMTLMDDYFMGSGDGTEPHMLQLLSTSTQCLQYHYMNKTTYQQEQTAQELLVKACHVLQQARPRVDMVYLEAVAKARYGLALVATWINDNANRGAEPVSMSARRMLESAMKLCELKVPEGYIARLYLMRLIVVKYSLDLLKRTPHVPALRWIIPPALRTAKETSNPDRFVICGARYCELRDAVVQVMLGSDPDTVLQNDDGDKLDLLLACYREVAVSSSNTPDKRHSQQMVDVQVKRRLLDYFTTSYPDSHKDFFTSLLNNSLSKEGLLNGEKRDDGLENDLIDLLVHLKLVVHSTAEPWPALLTPLYNMVHQPRTMQGAYLPTMPDDHTDDVRQAVLDARRHGGDRNPFLWQCPNGHPYIIGDCGRPYYEATCRECGAAIGGRNHRAATGNTQAVEGDLTRPGHIMGRASTLGDQTTPERDLSNTSTACLRMLLHLSMYLGASDYPRDVRGLIEPQAADVLNFVKEHLLRDVRVLERVTGCSRDDVFLAMHLIIHHMAQLAPQGTTDPIQLNGRQQRQQWEAAFYEIYMQPIIGSLREQLQLARGAVAGDTRLANSPLLCALHEVDNNGETTDNRQDLQRRVVWKYQQPSSPNTILQTLNELPPEERDHLLLLKVFLERRHFLAALKHLPDIVLLQQKLCQLFNYTLRLSSADDMSILDLVETQDSESSRREIGRLVESFKAAWELARCHMKNQRYGDNKHLSVSEEWCSESITDNSSALMLMPTPQRRGQCSLSLIHFLCTKQNDMVEDLARGYRLGEPRTTGVMDAGPSELLTIPDTHDLQLLLLQYTTYSTSTSQQQIDFAGLEKCIVTRYVKNRPRLKPQMVEMVFQDDLNVTQLFAQLETNIPQESISGQEQNIIKTEFRTLPDLCAAVRDLDIALGYIVASSVSKDVTIESFLSDTLKMKHCLTGNRSGRCEMRHMKTLWLALVFVKSQRLAQLNENPFPSIRGQVTLGDGELLDETNQVLTRPSNVQLSSFLRILFEFIVLQLDAEQLDMPLGDCLEAFSEDISDNTEISLPPGLQLRHTCWLWQKAILQLHKSNTI